MAEARRPKWLPSHGPGNMNVPPEKWGMTLRQWAAFIMGCRSCLEKWEELESSTDRKSAGHVNLYQICDHFVKPWTRNLGNSIALLLNNEEPLQAEVMISHAWGEDILQALMALLGRAAINGMSLDTVVWFCTFAQYQPGDLEGDCGPGVAEQLALDPFKKVINSKPRYGMVVIHTSSVDLYGRLWCVYEVNASQDCEVLTSAAASLGYFTQAFDLVDKQGMSLDEVCAIKAEEAQCWSKDDEAMIRAQIEAGIGYEALNEKTKDFRKAALERMGVILNGMMGWAEPVCERTGFGVDEVLESLATTVRAAAFFMGLACLTQLAQEEEDEEYLETIKFLAREPSDFTGEGPIANQCLNDEEGEEMATLPPGFDPKKRTRDAVLQEILEDDEKLVQALLDPTEHLPMALGWLEFGAGGSINHHVIEEVEAANDAAGDPMEAVKAVFRQYDSDGSGAISYEEMTSVLKTINPHFSDNDIDTILHAADANKDGQIDFEEFCDWLGASLC